MSLLQTQFEAFWNACPRKIGKGSARKAWMAATRLADADEIVAAMVAQVAAGVFGERKYTPYPATWLHAERWEDEIVAAGGADPRVKALADRWRKACRAGNDAAKAAVKADARTTGVAWEKVSEEVTRQMKEERL